MKRLSAYAVMLFFLLATLSVARGIEFAVDQLEKGNPGGTTASLKTFDQKAIKGSGKEIVFDVWMKDVPEELIGGGFWLYYDPSAVSVIKVDVYDGTVLPGPWDPEMSKQAPDPGGPGTYSVFVCTLSCVKPDKKGDVIIARVKLNCKDKCTKPIEIKRIAIPDFDAVVGCTGKLYDPVIKPATFTIHEK